MKKIIFIIIWFLTQVNNSFASIVSWIKYKEPNKIIKKTDDEPWMFDPSIEFLSNVWVYILYGLLTILCIYLLIKLIRLLFELYYAKNLVYLKVTVPRADSKLDKEKETKKDFKEKIWIMNM